MVNVLTNRWRTSWVILRIVALRAEFGNRHAELVRVRVLMWIMTGGTGKIVAVLSGRVHIRYIARIFQELEETLGCMTSGALPVRGNPAEARKRCIF
jgi:hypothetical protein